MIDQVTAAMCKIRLSTEALRMVRAVDAFCSLDFRRLDETEIEIAISELDWLTKRHEAITKAFKAMGCKSEVKPKEEA